MMQIYFSPEPDECSWALILGLFFLYRSRTPRVLAVDIWITGNKRPSNLEHWEFYTQFILTYMLCLLHCIWTMSHRSLGFFVSNIWVCCFAGCHASCASWLNLFCLPVIGADSDRADDMPCRQVMKTQCSHPWGTCVPLGSRFAGPVDKVDHAVHSLVDGLVSLVSVVTVPGVMILAKTLTSFPL